MKHQLRQLVLRLITNTPLESIARSLYGRCVQSKGNQYDQQTFELMSQTLRPDSNCIDVGAYRGEVLRQILELAPKGHHFAFEPVLENYRYVADKYGEASVYNIALSDKPGTATFQHVHG